ncbi:MAG: hypothetical protein AB1938_12785 [Myxococcota bacterium]
MKAVAPLCFAVALLSCNTNLRVDPEGRRCDVGGVCPAGYSCVEGVCRTGTPNLCQSVVCDAPMNTCADANTQRSFSGGCDARTGQCVFTPIDTPCASGCQAGACVDPCANVTCLTPPPPTCATPNTLRTFAATGTCSQGVCSYAPTEVTCPNGCVNGVCQGVDLCAGKTCDTPPAAVCNGSSLRTFTSPGTCDASTGQCVYAASDMPCPNGCVAAQCVLPPLTFTQVGPRVRFPITAIDGAPNSGGNSVVAVGEGGKLARWNGMAWTEVTTPANVNLNRVQFVTGSLAYVVGDNKTVWAYRPGTNALLAVSLPGGSGSARLVGLSGRSENDVFVTDEVGTWWRLTLTGWVSGSLPAASGPYKVTGAYLDESGRERIIGICGSSSCVAYRFPPPGATPLWRIDTRGDSLGFDAIGGGFDVPTTISTSEVFTGQSDNDLVVHTNSGAFSSQTVSPALEGDGIVGITAQNASTNRQVYVLTSSATNGLGHLVRLTRSGTTVTATTALDLYQGKEVLSPSEATGVIVAEVNRTGRSNNIFRRSIAVDQALDVGEDLVGASLDSAGTLVLSSIYGDVATLASGGATFTFRRPPVGMFVNGVEARRGTGILLAGELYNSGGGVVYRVLPSGFTELSNTPGTTWNAVCRVSDTEGWVVGSSGAIASVTASGVSMVASPTTQELLAIDCAPGVAVAVGVNGAVVLRNGGTWMNAPSLNTTSTLSSVALTGRGVYVGGDNVLARFESGAWAMLPARTGLKSLVARGPSDLYATIVTGTRTDIHRFDGAQWSSSLLQVTGALRGGVQVGGRVVWGGSGGTVVEGR